MMFTPWARRAPWARSADSRQGVPLAGTGDGGGRDRRRRRGVLGALLLVGLVASACQGPFPASGAKGSTPAPVASGKLLAVPGAPPFCARTFSDAKARAAGLAGLPASARPFGLFLWPDGELSAVPFWMKGTAEPLAVAFLDAHGLVLNVQTMRPESTTPHASPVPYSSALEYPPGALPLGPGVRVGIGGPCDVG